MAQRQQKRASCQNVVRNAQGILCIFHYSALMCSPNLVAMWKQVPDLHRSNFLQFDNIVVSSYCNSALCTRLSDTAHCNALKEGHMQFTVCLDSVMPALRSWYSRLILSQLLDVYMTLEPIMCEVYRARCLETGSSGTNATKW